MFYEFGEWKLYVETKKRAMPKSKIYKTRIRFPPKSRIHCEMVCCIIWPPQTNDKWERTKLKVKAYVLETIKMVNRNRPVKKLTNLLFWSTQGKTKTTWGSQLMTCSGSGANATILPILAKQIGWNHCELFELPKHDDRKTNVASKITYTHFCRKNPCRLDGEKT